MEDGNENATTGHEAEKGSPDAPDPTREQEDGKGLGALQVVSSVFAAGLGVQSSRNRERDFRQGRAGTFIVAGIIFTALFIGAVLTVVKLVLAGAG
ncbi:MAG: DUF2970 domain-containing protein [Pseudohaliea sp.]